MKCVADILRYIPFFIICHNEYDRGKQTEINCRNGQKRCIDRRLCIAHLKYCDDGQISADSGKGADGLALCLMRQSNRKRRYQNANNKGYLLAVKRKSKISGSRCGIEHAHAAADKNG